MNTVIRVSAGSATEIRIKNEFIRWEVQETIQVEGIHLGAESSMCTCFDAVLFVIKTHLFLL